MTPKAVPAADGSIRLSPLLDMLGVRYVIFRGAPVTGSRPAFQGPDYWVAVNEEALPRAFVPRQVETVENDKKRLEKMASPKFDARNVAYTESQVDVPSLCTGSAQIVNEIPTRVTLSLQMQTPGLVVLADLWDKGWHAYLDGRPVPILRVNHAVRGVTAGAGAKTLEFRYEPASFTWGMRLCLSTLFVLSIWLGIVVKAPKGVTQKGKGIFAVV
jgi:hypothetical protein